MSKRYELTGTSYVELEELPIATCSACGVNSLPCIALQSKDFKYTVPTARDTELPLYDQEDDCTDSKPLIQTFKLVTGEVTLVERITPSICHGCIKQLAAQLNEITSQ